MTGQHIITGSHIQEAMKIMYPFTMKTEGTLVELLRQIGLFDYRTVDALVATGSADEVHRLMSDSAHAILSFYQTLDENKQFRIKWGENIKKMVTELEPTYAEWFAKAKKQVDILKLIESLSSKTKNLHSRVKGSVSAILSTEEEANTAKENIHEAFNTLMMEVIEAKTLNSSQKAELFASIEEALNDSMAFVDIKLAEKPVHILYYRSGSRVSVKVNLNKNGYSYTQGRGGEVRYNKNKEDREKFPLTVSVNYIEDFLYSNKVRDVDILVDPASVDQFYSFENEISVNLTPSFIANWYNYDTPHLYRHTPNKHRSTNMLGQPLCHFSNKLVESSWSADYIDEDITEQEVQALSKGYTHTRITKEMRNTLEARAIKEAGKQQELKDYVDAFDAKVQEVINKNSVVILEKVAQKFPQRASVATGTDGQISLVIDDNFGLDCGFLNIQPLHAEYMEKRGILRNIESVSPWMNLKLPYFSQSTTVQKAQFNIVKDIVFKETGIELVGHTVLD